MINLEKNIKVSNADRINRIKTIKFEQGTTLHAVHFDLSNHGESKNVSPSRKLKDDRNHNLLKTKNKMIYNTDNDESFNKKATIRKKLTTLKANNIQSKLKTLNEELDPEITTSYIDIIAKISDLTNDAMKIYMNLDLKEERSQSISSSYNSLLNKINSNGSNSSIFNEEKRLLDRIIKSRLINTESDNVVSKAKELKESISNHIQREFYSPEFLKLVKGKVQTDIGKDSEMRKSIYQSFFDICFEDFKKILVFVKKMDQSNKTEKDIQLNRKLSNSITRTYKRGIQTLKKLYASKEIDVMIIEDTNKEDDVISDDELFDNVDIEKIGKDLHQYKKMLNECNFHESSDEDSNDNDHIPEHNREKKKTTSNLENFAYLDMDESPKQDNKKSSDLDKICLLNLSELNNVEEEVKINRLTKPSKSEYIETQGNYDIFSPRDEFSYDTSENVFQVSIPYSMIKSPNMKKTTKFKQLSLSP